MVSIIKVTPLYILVSGRKKLSTHSFWEPIIKRARVFCFVEVIQFFLIGFSCGVWCRGLTHNRIAWIRQLYNTLVSALRIPIMSRFQIYFEAIHLDMKYTQKPVSIFPNNVLLQSHEILHFLSFHVNIIFSNVFQTSPFCPYRVPDITTWSYQTRVFHLLITSWYVQCYLFVIDQ